MEFLLFILIVGLGVSGVSKVSYDLKAVKSKERQYDHKILHTVGSALQSVVAGDLPSHYHWLSRKRAVAVTRSGKPNFYWLWPLRGLTAGLREA